MKKDQIQFHKGCLQTFFFLFFSWCYYLKHFNYSYSFCLLYCSSHTFKLYIIFKWGFPGGAIVKNSPVNAGKMGSTPGSGRSSEEGNGNSFQYSCLENSIDRGARQAAFHRVTKSWTWWVAVHTQHTTFKHILNNQCAIILSHMFILSCVLPFPCFHLRSFSFYIKNFC